MTPDTKRLAATFSFGSPVAGMSLDECLRRAGATHVHPMQREATDEGERMACEWADMSCEAAFLPGGTSFAIWFWQSEFLDRVPENDAATADESDLVADAFRHACESLRPEVAFIVAHLDQATPERLRTLAEMRDLNALADARLGLLYVSEALDRAWVADPLRDDREQLPVDRGRLVFAGWGRQRWF